MDCLHGVMGHHCQRHRATSGPALSLPPLVKLQLTLALAKGGSLNLSPPKEALGPPLSGTPTSPPHPMPTLRLQGRHGLTAVLLIILRWFSFPPAVSCLPAAPQPALLKTDQSQETGSPSLCLIPWVWHCRGALLDANKRSPSLQPPWYSCIRLPSLGAGLSPLVVGQFWITPCRQGLC